MENIRVQRPSKDRCTSMDQLNVQRTWSPIPGLEITCGNWYNRVHFLQKKKDKRETYVRAVYNIRPQKTETCSTRLAVGGNLIYYPGEVSTPISDLTTMKLHVNSTILDVKSRYMCMELKYFYLNNKMDRAEYIIIQILMIPRKFVDKYNLTGKAHNGYIFSQVTKLM